MAGLIAMTSVLLVVTIEMFFAMRGAGHMHGSEWDSLPLEERERMHSHDAGDITHTNDINGRQKRHQNGRITSHHRRSGSQEGLVEGQSKPQTPHPDAPNSDPESDSESDLDLEMLDPTADESISLHHNHHPPNSLTPPQSQTTNPQKLLLQCLLLEAGILFHSIFIGISLSLSTGTPFIVLLIAISFHQTFEGLALGSRISALIPSLFPPSSLKPWLMALAYGTTTPIGQAMGLALQRRLYDPASTTALLSVGITNAVSSGLLLFAGLVELLAEDFLSDRSYAVLRGKRRTEACLSVAAGAVLMAIVGGFA
jgi:zinc transporter ZupT